MRHTITSRTRFDLILLDRITFYSMNIIACSHWTLVDAAYPLQNKLVYNRISATFQVTSLIQFQSELYCILGTFTLLVHGTLLH